MLMLGSKGLRIDHLWLETFFEGGFSFFFFSPPLFIVFHGHAQGTYSCPPYIEVNTAPYLVGRGT